MGDPHNQDVVQAIFIENDITFVVEVGRSATSKAIDRCPLQAHLRTRELYMWIYQPCMLTSNQFARKAQSEADASNVEMGDPHN